MFNALNRFISRLDGDGPNQKQASHGGFGFQVLRNANLQLAIEPWFDFIVGINGRMIVRGTLQDKPRVYAPSDASRTTRIRGSSRRRCGTAPEAT